MRHRIRTVSTLLFLALFAHRAPSQSSKLEDRLISARALYYTPTTAGLESFSCKVSVDWKGILVKATGAEIKDDNPRLQYLNSIQLTTQDRLRGAGSLEWVAGDAPTQQLADAIAQMNEGIKQMFSGFYQSWNAYMNGSMVPMPDKTTTLTQQGDGVHLHAAAGAAVIDEDYDRNMLMTVVHVATATNDITATPIFADTPDGRLITEIRSEVREPATAPPMYVNISVAYQTVSGYRVPATIHYDVKNALQMDFNLGDCTINPGAKQTSAQ